jgi:hypothetical protein
MIFGWLTTVDCECSHEATEFVRQTRSVTSLILSDGFALNVGLESWQVDRVHDCYNAAQITRLPFKLFISFDMTWVDITRVFPQNPVDVDYGSWTRVCLAAPHAHPGMT